MKISIKGTHIFLDYIGSEISLPTYSGIYMILNIVTGKKWIGQAFNISKRWSQHLCKFKKGNNSPSLQASWNKYGYAAFDFSVVEIVSRENLVDREAYYIELYKSSDKQFGYNLEKFDRRGLRIMSEETKKKISDKLKGMPTTGRPIGIPMSDQTKKVLSNLLKGRSKPNGWCSGENNPNFDKRGEETSQWQSVWYKNPNKIENKFVQSGDLPPEGWVKGRYMKSKYDDILDTIISDDPTLSLREIAKKAECSRGTVARWNRKKDLKA